MMAETYILRGKIELAASFYEQAIVFDLSDAKPIFCLGNLFYHQGDFEAALKYYHQALVIDPEYAEPLNNIGAILRSKGNLDEAKTYFERALYFSPTHTEALNNIGVLFKDMGEPQRAIDSFQKSLSLKPNDAEVYSNMAVTLKIMRDHNAAINCCNKALAILPEYVDAWINLGSIYADMNNSEAALTSFRRALSFEPNNLNALHNMGSELLVQGELLQAIESFKNVLKINPKYEKARVLKLAAQAQICDWGPIKEDRKYISKLGVNDQGVDPFALLSLEDAPKRHKHRAELYVKNNYTQKPISEILPPLKLPKRLRIGYFSGDFHNHPVSYKIAQTLKLHDRQNYELFAYSFGPDRNDAMREKISNAVDNFFVVHDMNDHEIATLSRKHNIDIAIDLTGLTENGRAGIFALRAAPVQINYLGMPGTIGANFIDYIVADQVLIPPHQLIHYTEKLIYLPHHYQAQDNTRKISDYTPSRSELGLPENGFVFCAINNSYKISPPEFNIWMRLLQRIEGSVLWILEANSWMKKNLQKEASIRDINSERLIFAQKKSHDSYLAQFRQADLFLDTFVYNAGATASDALWAGLPVLTKSGNSYAARMATSLLSSIELNELITSTEKDYENLAYQLATNPKILQGIKDKLSHNKTSTPLFDSELFTKHLEAAFKQAYQLYFDKKKPTNIFVNKNC